MSDSSANSANQEAQPVGLQKPADGASSDSSAAAAKQDAKQPVGLYWLFGAEAWERFSYYGMRAILVLYLVNQLTYERADALKLYGIYTAMVYLTPMLGGYLSDKFLGPRKAVIIGGCSMAIGELLLSVPSMLYPALTLLVLGNGFFKPNISNIVGGLYKENDPRRDGGFTIFYMGINLGAFFAPLVCGTLGQNFGYKYGFIAAGIGMILGQIIFNIGQSRFQGAGMPPGFNPETDGEARLKTKDYVQAVMWIGGVLAVDAAGFLFYKLTDAISPIVASVIIAAAVTAVLHYMTGKTGSDSAEKEQAEAQALTTEEKERIWVIVILAMFVSCFWLGFEQAGGTMTLFAENHTQRILECFNNFEIPASWFQSINPFIICTFAPLFSILWYKWDNSKYAISIPVKMSLGMIILGLGFILMFTANSFTHEGADKVTPLWLISVYFLHTMGELCLSPVGLSMVSKLAPHRLMSIMMGFWFLSSAIANFFAGTLEHLLESFHINLWAFLIGSSIGPGLLLLALTPILKKWMHGKA